MIYWKLDAETLIYPFTPEHSGLMYRLIQENQHHMNRWMQWSTNIHSVEDVRGLIELYEEKMSRGDGFNCGIWYQGELAGAIVCRYVDMANKNAEIGYWLGERFMGKGLATRSAERATGFLFEEAGLHRVEMQCGVDNVRSRAVPERLGYTLEGIRRESHLVGGEYADHAIYGMLTSDWVPRFVIGQKQEGA